ncbi:Crp/Fnr family transcriptional regulator [Chryseobacterium paridis]|uniref:Crp/Fnr family transcriptional regulator n=1 Tax=Chryseobacterium paridis TaxID=2800328 RepID=A0ABS1FV94_9FLAO|nr:Crp/Fnr family transcriptional regulator [Chryseobacterium paridis]MBK1896363.1 Crp/Fnr family transcriptional regulator [Chryseobacterium paridis]
MLRTNQAFLSYLEQLYAKQERKEDIIIKSFSKGKRILIQNEAPSKIMLISNGITKCYLAEENDKEFIIEFLGKGEIIGEIEFIKNINCLCSIEAMTEVSVYAISIPYFRSLLKSDLAFNNLLLDVFAERIVNTSTRASYQQLYTTEHNLEKLLKLQSQQKIEISKEDMASYLGVTIRSLNRALKSLNEK